MTEAAYSGNEDRPQIVITTHSPSFLSKLGERIAEIRLVTRVPSGGTVITPLSDVLKQRLGTEHFDAPLGEVWEMGLLEDVVNEALA